MREKKNKAGVKEQKELQEKGTEGEKTHALSIALFQLSCVQTNVFSFLHLEDVLLSHFFGTDLNYPMRSELSFITQ